MEVARQVKALHMPCEEPNEQGRAAQHNRRSGIRSCGESGGEKRTFDFTPCRGQDGGSVSAKASDDKRQANVLFGSANGQSTATVTFQEKN